MLPKRLMLRIASLATVIPKHVIDDRQVAEDLHINSLSMGD
jgi:hypothetical protein